MFKEADVYKIGIISKPHGVRGEVVFTFCDDVWHRVNVPYLFVRVDGLLVPFFIEEYRLRSECSALLKFQQKDDCDAVRELCGQEVYFPFALRPEDVDADDDELLWRCYCGFLVRDIERGDIGVIDDVDESTQNTLFVVGTTLIPATLALIEDIDKDAHVVTMRLPEGLTEI